MGKTANKEPELLLTILSTIKTTAQEPGTNQISGEGFCDLHRSELPCDVCEMLKQDREKARLNRIKNLMPNAQIGKRYQNNTFDDFDPTCQDAEKIKSVCIKYSETFRERLEHCDSIMMVGKPGTGKNLLAACTCR